MATVFSNPLFMDYILPFILVFTVVFAILQKSGILGKEKKQIDAIVALVVGLIVISFGKATGIIVNLMPVLAVALVVILVFLILFGSLFAGELSLNKGLKITGGILAAIVVLVAVLYNTGAWSWLVDLFTGEGSEMATNLIFIALVIAAVAVVIGFSGKAKSD